MTALQLLGLKHTGKSSLGRLWAQRFGWDFYDLDHLLETQAGGARTSRQIFLDEGKTGFQQHETRAARFIANRLAQGRAVLAWGGGTVTNSLAVEALRPAGTLILLTDRCEVLYERILRGGLPAFLSADRPWEDFQDLYRERTALLEALTPYRVDLNGMTVDRAFEELQTLWNTIPQPGNS
jgi:shikimate kinase